MTLTACNKQQTAPQKRASTTGISSKSGEEALTDFQLIEIIKGRNRNYSKTEAIEEVLFDNCRLSSPVLRALIDEKRFPDYIVEEMMILSAPSGTDISYLTNSRPGLATATIVSSTTIDWTASQFAVFNLNPRQIFVAKNLKQKLRCSDGCGESEWKGENFKVLELTSITTALDPLEMQSCNSGKWVCGRSIETRIVLISEGVSTVYTRCQTNEEKCVRKASEPKK